MDRGGEVLEECFESHFAEGNRGEISEGNDKGLCEERDVERREEI